MQDVRVYNDNVFPHKEKFKGEMIELLPKKYIVMDYYDAIEFLGQYTPIKTDGGGAPLPESFKMLRIVKPEHFKIEDSKLIKCQACGEVCSTTEELDAHVNEKHIEQLVDEDEVKKRKRSKKKTEEVIEPAPIG
jgi:uncharacterized C2H2 Zn-finger protein